MDQLERDCTGFSFADIDATFQCSSDLREKIFFETWQKHHSTSITWSMGYYDDYVGDNTNISIR